MVTTTGTMTAAVYHGRGDVRIEEREIPGVRPGEALIRVLRSGMCGSDATEFKSGPLMFPVENAHPVSKHLGPMILGHEFVGEIVDLPGGDGDFTEGDIVASGAGISCGECARCREGRTNLCERYATVGLSMDGGMAEYVAVPVSTLVRVPAGMALDRAGLAQPLAVGLHAVRRSRSRNGDRILLFGAGAIGTFVLAGLVHLIDSDVTVVDFAGDRLDRAQRLGAHRVEPLGDDLAERLLAIGGPAGFDVVIEASGAPGQLDAALAQVRRGGTILQVGLPSKKQELNVHKLVLDEVSIETTLAHVCGEDLAPALEILGSSDLGPELLEAVYPLHEVPQQLARLAGGEIQGKVLFDPTLVS